jgi:enediyne biosynthesis protein E4
MIQHITSLLNQHARSRALGALLLLVFFSSCKEKKQTLFTSLPASHTNIDFRNDLPNRKLFNILYYLYYYNGGGVAIGDINNDSLPDIYFSANDLGKNKLYLNKGNLRFEDITEKAGVAGTADWCSGVTMADINGDGLLDIYVSAISQAYGLKGQNQLYINNGNSTFTESAARYGLNFSGFSTQAAFFDYDHDGDLDCYLLNQSQKPNQNIVDTSNRRKFDPLQGDRFYRNELISDSGSRQMFTDVSASTGIYQSNLGYGLGIAVADINNDGWEDVYIGNDFHENDYYYINTGNGSFRESGAQHFRHYSRFSMGNDVADYNNDGQLDVVTVDMLPPDEKVLKTYASDENPEIYRFKLERNGFQLQYSRNCLQRNNGNGSSFSEVGLIAGIPATDWSWCPLFADFDNDGNKDLFISSGIVKRPVDLDYVMFISDKVIQKSRNISDEYDDEALAKMPGGEAKPFLFKGDGKLSFKEISSDWGTGDMSGFYNGAAYADLDNDGDLDLAINSLNAPAVILQNNAPAKNHISISFNGDSANTFGVGAKAWVFQQGKFQYQQLMLTRGFQSSGDTRLHFGLDSSAAIDSILVVWPDQTFQVIKNPPVNKSLVVRKSAAAGKFLNDEFFRQPPPVLTPVPSPIAWTHRENHFTDFNVQYLIPHAQSTRGPKLAVGDVNNDGLEDFYACGASGQPGALMLQSADGKFREASASSFAADAGSEDVDALFFDANNDGSNDLLVISGGNEYNDGNPALADRLYINDGKGSFTKSATALPPILKNKSCAAAADIDKDGDQDLFIGALADAKAYGIPQTSYLLINNGQGAFSFTPGNVISLEQLGMVTSAKFADINNDSNMDLVVAGEWMPLTIFINKGKTFERKELPSSTGFWQTIHVEDANGDGKQDILAGNWGWNNKYFSGKNGPVRMYVKDFDRNGRVDQLVSYTVKDVEYPFLVKDEVERWMPVLKKHYLLYKDYAGVPMKDVYYGFVDTVKPFVAERLGSAVCFGDGNGGFNITDLPADLQLAPVMSFQRIATAGNSTTYLAGGNFFDVVPYEGKYDAQPLAAFSITGTSVQYVHQPGLLSYNMQVRDVKWIKNKSGNILVAAPNNGSLLFFKTSQ